MANEFYLNNMELIEYERVRSCYLVNCGFETEQFSDQIRQIEQIVNVIVEERKLRKRVVFVAIESIQNVTRHGLLNGYETKPKFVLGKTDEGVFIIVSNAVNNNQVSSLTEQLDAVQQLSKDELQRFVVKRLQDNDFAPSGGAGIGLHSMALKSDGRLTYDIRPFDSGHSCFTLRVDFANLE